MKRIKLDLENEDETEKVLKTVRHLLESGSTIIYPTDTLYGFGVNAFDENAIKNIYRTKKQKNDKPISVLVKDIKTARKIACIDSKVEKILNNIWPGPITVVLRKKDIISYSLTGNKETIAIRIANNKFISMLMKEIDFPITTTSVNISGEKNLLTSTEIIEKFKNERIALFLDAGNIKNSTASTIVDLTTTIPKILRIGIIGKNKMQDFFKKFNV